MMEAAARAWLAKFGCPSMIAGMTAQPRTFKEVLNAALELGRANGCLLEAMKYLGDREKDLAVARRSVGADRGGCVRGTQPPSAVCLLADGRLGGRWLPDVLHLAGLNPVGPHSGDEHLSPEGDTLHMADVIVAEAGAPLDRTLKATVVRTPHNLLEPGPHLYDVILEVAAAVHGNNVLKADS